LKVVDLASFIAGPSAATILSDFGAEVIKVEPSDGELWRREVFLSGGQVAASFYFEERGGISLVLGLRRDNS
jgi:crotonobetainyl-CoA:carnitine CoA-transferase CaiB-like acyl-CoA transferase